MKGETGVSPFLWQPSGTTYLLTIYPSFFHSFTKQEVFSYWAEQQCLNNSQQLTVAKTTTDLRVHRIRLLSGCQQRWKLYPTKARGDLPSNGQGRSFPRRLELGREMLDRHACSPTPPHKYNLDRQNLSHPKAQILSMIDIFPESRRSYAAAEPLSGSKELRAL